MSSCTHKVIRIILFMWLLTALPPLHYPECRSGVPKPTCHRHGAYLFNSDLAAPLSSFPSSHISCWVTSVHVHKTEIFYCGTLAHTLFERKQMFCTSFKLCQTCWMSLLDATRSKPLRLLFGNTGQTAIF